MTNLAKIGKKAYIYENIKASLINMHRILSFTYNLFEERTYVVSGAEGRCAVVDPGFCNDMEQAAFFGSLEEEKLVPEAVLLTHGHFDHMAGAAELQRRYGIPVYMNEADRKVIEDPDPRIGRLWRRLPDRSFRTDGVSDGDKVETAGLTFEVIATPGHTPGGVCWLSRDEKLMFTGDTLFAGAIGRTDLKYGEYDDEIRSIMEKLMLLDGDIRILPGHGPASTIADERTGNPFLEPFNEPEEEADPDQPPVIIRPGA